MFDDWWTWFWLAGAGFWLIPIVCGVAAAAIAVAVVGPRDADSVIVPGMAASAASFVGLFELEDYVGMAALGVVVAAATALGQRWAIARLDPSAPSWPQWSASLTVLAGVLVGAFFGYAAGRRIDPELIIVGASLGAVLAAALTVRWGRSERDPD
ncbi:MAG TPA: hypothetical protein VFJ71_12690 [Candidatus Limnocylindrales bacterium]|nr:hypothetical protein [Candidatus Limnocylindrales bacterium]